MYYLLKVSVFMHLHIVKFNWVSQKSAEKISQGSFMKLITDQKGNKNLG